MAYRVNLKARSNQHYVYSGRSLLVTNLDGWMTGKGTEGFYFENTRLLSRDEILIDGVAPRPASVSPVGSDAFQAYYEASPSPSVPERTIYLEVRRRAGEGLLTEVELTNFGRDETLSFDLSCLLEADFADSDEAETGRRQQKGAVATDWDASGRALTFRYCHESLDRAAVIRVQSNETPVAAENGRLCFSIVLPPRASTRLALSLAPLFDGDLKAPPSAVFGAPLEGPAALSAHLHASMPVLDSSNHTVVRAWRTATSDLASLPLGLPDGPAAPAAGFPLYQQFFGRDSLTISWQALMAGTEMMRDSLRANAAWQGTKIDDWLDEQPGKMLHQARWGPLSLLGINPYTRYYGDWATPVDFLIMVGQYFLWTGDGETTRELLPATRKVLTWIDDYGDVDRDGFLEYQTRSSKGVKHQGWKDSDDAIVDVSGRLVEPPLACCEIQAYWYAGLQMAATAFLLCGDRLLALRLFRESSKLRRRFNKAFWMEKEGFYAMALAPNGVVADAISSNPGHLLAAGIVPRDRARVVADRLMAPDMFSGWGIRTLSAANPFYNPFSYHRGSVWPVEQGTIAFGFARYGLWDHLDRLCEGAFALTDLFADNRLPEVVSGLPRDEMHPHPGIYPYSCEPQGWSASAIVLLVQSLLGLRPIAPLNLLVIDPHLPPWLPDLTIQGLHVGSSHLDLRFRRTGSGKTDYKVLAREGPIRVMRQPVPDGGPTLPRKVLDLLTSLPKS